MEHEIPVVNIHSEEEKEQYKQSVLSTPVEELLRIAAERGKEAGMECAGALMPAEAWALMQAGAIQLVDVRTIEEYKFVGHPVPSVHVPLVCGPNMVRNPGFLHEMEKTVPRHTPIVLMCRSGMRSIGACEALTRAGYEAVYNLQEGFEGSLNRLRHRGTTGGWRYWGLDWIQD